MITLTYGRKKPEDLDPGSIFWDALADNITLDDSHDHDGTDSARILTSNLTRGSVTVTSAAWTANADGTYKKSVTMPGAHTWGACQVQVFRTSDNAQIAATIVRTAATTFDLYAFAADDFTVLVT